MKNNTYMCLLRSSTGECEQPSASEMELQYAKYQAWQQKFADNILDMGNKLGSAGSVVRQESASDGPYIELKEMKSDQESWQIQRLLENNRPR